MGILCYGVLIRVATESDLESLLTMGQQLHEVESAYEPLLTFSIDKARQRYERAFANPNALFLIAESTNRPVGYLYAHAQQIEYFSTDQLECEIEVVFVSEPFRGQGVAGQLIDACIAWAKDKNIFRFSSGIYARNTASQSAFLKHGFTPHHATFILTNDS